MIKSLLAAIVAATLALTLSITSFAAEEATGSLEVSVIAKTDKKPIPGARVNLYQRPAKGKRKLVLSARTDQGGKFAAPHLKPGSYKYTVIARGYGLSWKAFRVKGGEAVRQTMTLLPEAIVTGRFIAPDDTPLSGIDLLMSQGMLTTTNPDGSFTAKGIRKGEQRLRVMAPDWMAEAEPTLRLAPGKKVDLGVIRLARSQAKGGVNRPVAQGLARSLKKNLAVKEGTGETVVPFPKEAMDEGGVLEISLSPTLETSLNVALLELAEAPFASVEQTMARFLPAMQVQRLLGPTRFTLDPVLAGKLPRLTAEGLAQIYAAQHGDGGWGWWPEDASDPYLTSHVILGLAELAKGGIEIRQGVVPRGVKALEGMVPCAPPAVLPFVYRALTAAGSRNTAIETVMEKDWRRLQPSEKLPYIAGLLNSGQKDLARAFLNEARKLVHMDGSSAYLRDDDAYSWWYSGRWGGSAVETTALFLSCQLALDPKDPLAPKLVEFLVRNRAVPGWNTNRATAVVITALARYLALADRSTPSYRARLLLNDRELSEIKVAGGLVASGKTALSVPASGLLHGENRLRLVKEGAEGVLFLNADLEYLVPPSAAIRAPGITFQRSAFRVSPQQAEGVPVSPGETLAAGEVLEVRLTVANNEPLNHVVLEDLLPSGCRLLDNRDLADSPLYRGWYGHRERFGSRVNFYISNLPAGKHEFRYRATATRAERLPQLPAALWPVYMPTLRTESVAPAPG